MAPTGLMAVLAAHDPKKKKKTHKKLKKEIKQNPQSGLS